MSNKLNILLKIKDNILDRIDNATTILFKMQLPKLARVLNNYVRGELIVVSGRKTAGKSSYILKTYVMDLLKQKQTLKKEVDLKILYFSTGKSYTETILKMASYNAASKYENMGMKKISTASFFRYDGAIKKFPKQRAKQNISSFIDYLKIYISKGYLNVMTGSYTIDEILTIIRDSFSDRGLFSDNGNFFEYTKDDSTLLPIIIIDNVSLITGDNGANCVRNENASRLGLELKKLAKILDAIIVINVPSTAVVRNFGKKEKFFTNSIDEINPYTAYADKVLFIHNPMETEDFHPMGYTLEAFY